MVQRILVFLPRCIGDTLLATPMLRQLKRLRPNSQVHVVCSRPGRAVLQHNPHVNQLTVLPSGRAGAGIMARLSIEAWRQPYDLVIDGSARVKTAILTRLTGAPLRHGAKRRWPRNKTCYTYSLAANLHEYAGRWRIRLLNDDHADLNDLRLEFPTAVHDQQTAKQFCEQRFTGPVAALYACCSEQWKQWPLEMSVQIGRQLTAAGYQVLLLHGPGQLEEAQQVGQAIGGNCIADYPTHSLPVMKEVLARCEFFVGNDGGPKHIANAAGIPTVAVFGSVRPEEWTEPNRADQRYVSTRYQQPGPGHFGTLTTAENIREIPVAAVWQEVEAVLSLGSLASQHFAAA